MEQNSLKPSAAADANGIISDASVKKYLKSFPEGYRFLPTDFELVEDYLTKKINNKTLAPNLIHEVNLYDKDPTQFTAEYEAITETEWYFFTHRDKKYRFGSRPNRATPNGYWKAYGTIKPIPHVSNHPIGYKTTLDFHAGRHPLGTKTIWRMNEYVVKDNNNKSQSKNDMTLDDWVVCKIYKRKPRRDKKTTTATQPPTVNIAQNNEASLMVENNNSFEDQNWNASQPMANISGNKGASLMVGNNNLAFEDQNWNAFQPTTPNQGSMHDWKVSQSTPYQGQMHEDQNWNVSQTTSYQGPMHEDQNWNASQPTTPNHGPVHEDHNWKVSQPTPYQGQLHEAQNWNVSQPTPYQGPVHEVQNWNVSQPTPYQGPMHEDQNQASFWDCDFDTLDDQSSGGGI